MKPKAKVIDLAALKQKRRILENFDRLEHEDNKAKKEKRAEVERKARNTN
ncbi:hypothetical protein ACHMW6_06555 [Pseudoduganella sp. UC29_106]